MEREKKSETKREERDWEKGKKNESRERFLQFLQRKHKNGLERKNAFPLLNNKYKMPSHPLNSIQTALTVTMAVAVATAI